MNKKEDGDNEQKCWELIVNEDFVSCRSNSEKELTDEKYTGITCSMASLVLRSMVGNKMTKEALYAMFLGLGMAYAFIDDELFEKSVHSIKDLSRSKLMESAVEDSASSSIKEIQDLLKKLRDF